MTEEEAIREAQKRWGAKADAWKHSLGDRCTVAEDYTNGTIGIGDSFEAAFADADRREGGTK